MVYICALAPDADETSQTQQSNFPKAAVFSHIEVKDGRIRLLPEGIDDFAGDLPDQGKKLVLATQGVPKPDLFVAKRMGATVTEVASSHVPMLSHTDVVINVIRAAAKGVQSRATVA